MKKVELLSPAGNMDCLKQAIHNGCNAVYLGGKKFGARKYADNFSVEEMIEAIKYCHLYSVKIYVTVNTVIYEEEFPQAIEYIKFLYTNGVDAIIMQDFGLINVVRNTFPDLEIHASTQCHNHNIETIKTLKDLGVKRCVLARELSLSEVKKIKEYIDVEVFVHGALCTSYSGCCLFSSLNGGRSGNRGECVGSCRLPYTLYKNDTKISTDGDYLLSTKSLCTLSNIGELIDCGITSFKIEGRMKSPEYVGYVTKVYRDAIDKHYNKEKYIMSDEVLNNLKKLYNREFTLGYLFDKHGRELMNIKTSNHIGIPLGEVISIDYRYVKIKLNNDLYQEDGIRFDNDFGMIVNKLYNEKELLVNKVNKGEIALIDKKIEIDDCKYVIKTTDSHLLKELETYDEKKIDITIECFANLNEKLKIIIKDDKNTSIEATNNNIEKAINNPTSKERVEEQLNKLGNTPFKSISTIVHMNNDVFISIKELNELRRKAIDKLINIRENVSSNVVINKYEDKSINDYDKNIKINLLVREEEQLKACLDSDVDNIYVTEYELYSKYSNISNVFYRTIRVPNEYIKLKNKNVLATELGAVNYYSKDNNVVSDYYLNIVNSHTINYLKRLGVSLVTLSPENSKQNIIEMLKEKINVELIVYGKIELMVMKYCPLNMIINKDDEKCNLCRDENKYYLVDRFNNKMRIINDKHLTHIMHHKNIDFYNDIDSFIELGINNFRIELLDEKYDEVIQIIKEMRSLL